MLYIAATPIGNMEDVTLRCLRILKEADFVLAEDTRKTGKLLNHFGIKNQLISFYEHNEEKKIPRITAKLKAGEKAVLVSSAGTPLISDPGFKLVRECRRQGIEVRPLPGPSSLITALSSVSLASDKFVFLGYLPRKKGSRQKLFSQIKDWRLSVVFFESPHRLLRTLEELKDVFGDCQIAVCREMTKKFEEFFQGGLARACRHFSQKKPRGEFTLILAPASQE